MFNMLKVECNNNKTHNSEQLIEFIRNGLPEEAYEFLEKGIDVNFQNSKGRSTALMYAAEKGYTEIVCKLLELKAGEWISKMDMTQQH